MIKIGSTLEPKNKAQSSMIWLHGLGASSDDMAGLAQQFSGDTAALRHVFVDAPIRPVTINGHYHMPAWYDIVGDKITDREDEAGITESEQGIREIISQQIQQGIDATQIFLAGFSQGGAMALHTGLRFPQQLAGIICLSGYMPLTQTLNKQLPVHTRETPIFFASGQFDPIVKHEWALTSKLFLEQRGCQHITFKSYAMEHNVCPQEILDLMVWIKHHLLAF